MNNYLQRFLLEDLDIRGAIVKLDSVWQCMLVNRNYPDPVIQILGEITVSTLLFGSNFKQPGRLTVQLSGDGPVSFLVVDCDETLQVRGMAKCDEVVEEASAPNLLGQGQLVLSLDMPSMRETYQSIVPLEGDSVAEIFEHYLEQSEQTNSRLFLNASPNAIVGILLQKLPATDNKDLDGWTRIEALTATAKEQELLSLSTEELLTRLFNEEVVRVFEPQLVSYGCQKDLDKIHDMLRSLGREEIDAILQEIGEVVINDDICNQEYRFDALAIDAIFSEVSTTIH